MELFLKVSSVAIGLLLTGVVVVSSPNSKSVMHSMNSAYSGALRAALGRDALDNVVELSEKELNARAVADMEHEMMIAGHEDTCDICIEADRKKSAIEKWAGKDWARWRR